MAIVVSLVLLFLGIGILILVHVCIVGRTLRQGLMAAQLHHRVVVERGGLGSTSMSRDQIEKLPCFDFQGKEGTSPAAVCAVCLERFLAGEKCRLLPSCNHSFHAECVDVWLMRASVCPICRAGALFCEGGIEINHAGGDGGTGGLQQTQTQTQTQTQS